MVVGERTLTLLYRGHWIAVEYERIGVCVVQACAFCGNTDHDVVVDHMFVDTVHPIGQRMPDASADAIRRLVQAMLYTDIPHCGNCRTTLDSRRRLLIEAFDGQAPTTW